MAELIFFTGPMDCGKSTLALQLDYTQAQSGRQGRRFSGKDRSGMAMISTRVGLARPAVEVTENLDFWKFVVDELTRGFRIDYLICDEAQFYSAAQVDQLARVADDLDIEVFAFGITTDFRTQLFPGSKRLVELADRIERLQVAPLCWCGARAIHNARTDSSGMVTTGAQVAVGDIASAPGSAGAGVSEVAYEVLCRKHHRRRMTREAVNAAHADPLPWDEAESG